LLVKELAVKEVKVWLEAENTYFFYHREYILELSYQMLADAWATEFFHVDLIVV